MRCKAGGLNGPLSSRLPEAFRSRIHPLASAAGKTVHAWLVDAIAAGVTREEARAAFVADATATLDLILDGLQVLIGRAAEHGFRELVISRGRSGSAALYEYLAVANEVRVHAVRQQREVGYGGP